MGLRRVRLDLVTMLEDAYSRLAEALSGKCFLIKAWLGISITMIGDHRVFLWSSSVQRGWEANMEMRMKKELS